MALGLVGQGLDNAIVGGMLAEVGKPEQSSALGGEDGRDPAEGVIEVPDGDTNAAADLDASTDNLYEQPLAPGGNSNGEL